MGACCGGVGVALKLCTAWWGEGGMSPGAICGKVAGYTGGVGSWAGSWATAGWMDRAATPCGATASRGMAAGVFGTIVWHGMARGAPVGWGSLTACRGRAGDVGRGAARLGKITAGEKY